MLVPVCDRIRRLRRYRSWLLDELDVGITLRVLRRVLQRERICVRAERRRRGVVRLGMHGEPHELWRDVRLAVDRPRELRGVQQIVFDNSDLLGRKLRLPARQDPVLRRVRGHDEGQRKLRRVRQCVPVGRWLPKRRLHLSLDDPTFQPVRLCVREHTSGQCQLRRVRNEVQ